MKKCPYEENKRCTKDCKYALTCIQRKAVEVLKEAVEIVKGGGVKC